MEWSGFGKLDLKIHMLIKMIKVIDLVNESRGLDLSGLLLFVEGGFGSAYLEVVCGIADLF